jgi:type VI secretion system protein ImpH
MAHPHRQDPAALIQDVLSRPWEHDFFLALRRVESAHTELPRIGRSKSLRQDPVRFGQYVSLAFATSALEEPHLPKQKGQKLMVRFTGLTGPNGALPLRITDFIRNRQRGIYDSDIRGTRGDATLETGTVAPKDSTLAEFLDIFHHRAIALFYRAWAAAQKSADLDRTEDRTFAEWIASLCGTGLPAMEDADAVPGIDRLAFAGHLACPTRHSSGLRGILESYFDTPAEVLSFAGQWLDIPPDQRCSIGHANSELGRTAIAGRKLWDRQMKCQLRLGPMRLAQFELFLPGGVRHARLHAWMRLYTRETLYWEAAIILHKADVPATKLGAAGRLGYTTWLVSGAPDRHADQFCVRGGGLTPGDNT